MATANTGPLFFPGASGEPFSYPTQQGGDSVSYPLAPYQTQARVITAQFMGLRSGYVRPADNAPKPGREPGFYFCNDSPLQDIGAGLVRFTRTWANVPTPWVFTESYSYTYPAQLGHRWSTTHVTTSQLAYSYYLTGLGAKLPTPGYIPCPAAFNPIYGLDDNSNTFTYLNAVSQPSLTQYLLAVSNDAANPSQYSLLAEDGIVSNYQGNIWRLALRLIKFRGK